MLKIIVAMDKNRLIGKSGALPWHISDDLKHFKEETFGKTVIMGAKTFESLGRKPLSHRRNIVVADNNIYDNFPGIEVYHELIPVFEKYKGTPEEIYVIGGASIYRQAIPYADEIVLSYIEEGEYQGDTYLDAFEKDFIITKTVSYPGFKVLYYKRVGD